MRGFLQPALRHLPTEAQSAFHALSRHRRFRIARDAKTTLVKADQWGRGEIVAIETASALEASFKALATTKKTKKKKP
jgi:hypothetical protein